MAKRRGLGPFTVRFVGPPRLHKRPEDLVVTDRDGNPVDPQWLAQAIFEHLRSTRWVYLMERNGLYKIGVAYDVEKRSKQVGAQVIHIIPVNASTSAFEAERLLHLQYADKRVEGEWFRLGEQDVSEIKRLWGTDNVADVLSSFL